jgi:hypothetical protein
VSTAHRWRTQQRQPLSEPGLACNSSPQSPALWPGVMARAHVAALTTPPSAGWWPATASAGHHFSNGKRGALPIAVTLSPAVHAHLRDQGGRRAHPAAAGAIC